MDLSEQADWVKFMIRDRGSNFTAIFDAVLADAGIRTVLCNVATPRMKPRVCAWVSAGFASCPGEGVADPVRAGGAGLLGGAGDVVVEFAGQPHAQQGGFPGPGQGRPSAAADGGDGFGGGALGVGVVDDAALAVTQDLVPGYVRAG
jgi:hypothetical protein